MSQTVKIVFLKQSPEDKVGTLYVRQTENRKSKVKSLKIKISEKDFNRYWSESSQRFSKNQRFGNGELYNQTIEDYFKTLVKYENLSNVPREKKSFLKYWEHKIKSTSNHGSKIKYEVIYSKLLKFLSSINKTDLLFKDVTPSLINDLRYYLITAKDPKQLSNNSTIHYLKVVRGVIDSAIEEEEYLYIKHPFTAQKFVKEVNKKKILSDNDITTLINKEIENETLSMSRDMFLLQVFTNGMRVSDLMLLKWNYFKDGRLNYLMFKTFFEVNIPMNINMCLIIAKYIDFFDMYKLISDRHKIPYQNEYTTNPIKLQSVTLDVLDEILKAYNSIDGKMTFTKRSLYKISNVIKNINGGIIDYKGFKVGANDENIKKVINTREKLLAEIDAKFISGLVKTINQRKTDDFVFPMIDKELFKNFDIKKLTLEQYKHIKHNTIVYDRRLKKVQEICNIDVPLTSHVARHSFTNQLLSMDNVNLYDISKSLGHSKIQTTENYIMDGFHTQKIDYISEKFSSKFSRK